MNEILRPLSGDLLLKRCDSPCDPHENGSALILTKREVNAEFLWFDVVAIGAGVTEVAVGDKVMVPLGQYTLPVMWGNERYVVTAVTEVWMVC